MALPPLFSGVFHVKFMLQLTAGTAVKLVGADGAVQGVAGVTGPHTFDHSDLPAEFTARALNEYLLPFVNCPMIIVVLVHDLN